MARGCIVVISTSERRFKNLRGSQEADQIQSGSSAISYWSKVSGRPRPSSCQRRGCNKPATDGAHVKLKGHRSWYILPTCHGCNVGYKRQWIEAKVDAIAVKEERIERMERVRIWIKFHWLR